MIVADSDVLIDALRGKDPARSRVALELDTGALATTCITVFELESGARSPREREKVSALLSALTILPLDSVAAADAAEARRTSEVRGDPIGTADYLIAGICRSRAAILLTRNRKHFERVPGLKLGTFAG